MHPLHSIGQDLVSLQIEDILRTEKRPIVVLDGPQASGKSSILRTVESQLSQQFRAQYARGDVIEKGVDEYAIQSRVERIPRREAAEFAIDAAEDIRHVLDDGEIPFGRLLHRVAAYVTVGLPPRNISDTQQRFLFRLLNVFSKRTPLLLCDDLQYWDRTSLLFLRHVVRGDLNDTYKQLQSMPILIALDADRIDASTRDVISDIRSYVPKNANFKLRRPTLVEFPLVLNELGLTIPITDNVTQDIFALTGGNLALSSSLVAYLESGAQLAEASPQPHLSELSFIFAKLIKTLEEDSKDIKTVVAAAVASGRELDFDILSCLMGLSKSEVKRLAGDAAAKLHFISVSESHVSVTHESIRSLLSALFGAEQRERHSILARCLSRIRPGDYGHRAAHLEAAGDIEGADALRAMERLSGIRSGRYGWKHSYNQEPKGHLAVNVAAWSKKIDNYFEAVAAGGISDALEILEAIDFDLPPLLILETRYLKAQLLSDMNEDAKVQRALGLIEELDVAATDEGEIWGRAKETEIICLSNLRQPIEGRRVEQELRRRYQERTAFDPDAQFALNRLRRKSEAIHIPEVANDRLRLALAFFGPGRTGDVPLHWAEYIATLNNLCANEMVLGRFEQATKYAARLSEVAAELAADVLRRPQYIWSNVLLTQHLNGAAPNELVRPFEAILQAGETQLVDSMLLAINLSAIRAHAGKIEIAAQSLSAEFEAFDKVEAASPYVRHFAASNLSVLHWLLGKDDIRNDMERRAELALMAMAEAEYSHPFLRQRGMILESLYKTATERTLMYLERQFVSFGPRVGPSWRFFGRPLLVTDIQYWADP
jgi:hypothetical protein